MSPLKKRLKKAEKNADTCSTDVPAPDVPSLEDIDGLFKHLIQAIQSANDEKDVIFPSLFSLKAWQHDLLKSLQKSEIALEEGHKRRKKQEEVLASLAYERNHLDKELEICRNFEMANLRKLVSQESSDTDLPVDGSTPTVTDEQVAAFLGEDIHDPDHHQKITARLQQEITYRGSLERDLKNKQQDLGNLKAELKSKTDFLDKLPNHLASLERSSAKIQTFMKSKQPRGQKSFAVNMIGSDREKRIDRAQSLPPPLYTLFQQMQHYLDHAGDELDDGSSDDQVTLGVGQTKDDAEKTVEMRMEIPDVTLPSGRRKQQVFVTIVFSYNATIGLVSAFSRGGNESLNHDTLLDQLFPNDSPSAIDGVQGRPYHWCNYLAGLHTLPESTTGDQNSRKKSTRVIVRELQRRIRANTILNHILYSLKRQHIPSPPTLDDDTLSSSFRLSKFESASGNNDDSHTTVFETTLEKDDSKYKMTVSMNTTTYPREIPQWCLFPSSDSNGSQLYDDRLAAVESFVNESGIENIVGGDQTENAYEWILVHQLRYICKSIDCETNHGESTRMFKGRDRRPVQNH